jgi:iron complex outermembrane receptor protein
MPLTLQGDYFGGKVGNKGIAVTLDSPYFQIFEKESSITGGNLLSRWQRSFSETSDLLLQINYEFTERDELQVLENRDTFDLDFQHRFGLGERQDIMWGFGYRFARVDIVDSPTIAYTSALRKDHLFSFFLQDEISLWPDKFSLLIGSKFEDNGLYRIRDSAEPPAALDASSPSLRLGSNIQGCQDPVPGRT